MYVDNHLKVIKEISGDVSLYWGYSNSGKGALVPESTGNLYSYEDRYVTFDSLGSSGGYALFTSMSSFIVREGRLTKSDRGRNGFPPIENLKAFSFVSSDTMTKKWIDVTTRNIIEPNFSSPVNTDSIIEGSYNKFNVQSDWNSTSGASQILNRPFKIIEQSFPKNIEIDSSYGTGTIIKMKTWIGAETAPSVKLPLTGDIHSLIIFASENKIANDGHSVRIVNYNDTKTYKNLGPFDCVKVMRLNNNVFIEEIHNKHGTPLSIS